MPVHDYLWGRRDTETLPTADCARPHVAFTGLWVIGGADLECKTVSLVKADIDRLCRAVNN